MEILYCGKRNESLSFKEEVKCYTWNSLYLNKEEYDVIYGFDSKNAILRNGFFYTKSIKEYAVYEKDYKKDCTHILLSDCAFDQNWAYPSLKKIIKPNDRVCVCALTFFDDTKNERDWNVQYKQGQGYMYRMNNDVFFKYGIQQIEWIHYFTDSKEEMLSKILNSSILYIPGGAPDWFLKRVKECKLKRALKNYKGTMIGVSAGAMAQLDEYHITPDDEYPDFKYERGLGCLAGFDVEVHYAKSNQQKQYIKKVVNEKHIPVYAIGEKGGMIVKDSITLFGNVEVF